MITKREVLRVGKPVVLIAEELSAATLDALGPDFEVRNCDGANRAELLAALGAGVDAVRVLERELAAPRDRSGGADGPLHGSARSRGRGVARQRRASACHRQPPTAFGALAAADRRGLHFHEADPG